MRAAVLTSKRAKALRRKMSPPEVLLWSLLRRRLPDQPAFRRQHPMGAYVLDFYCAAARLAVEVDGHGHGEDDQRAHDQRRDAWFAIQRVRTYRVTASRVMWDAAEVADELRTLALGILQERLTNTSPDSAPGLAPSTTPSARSPSPAARGRN